MVTREWTMRAAHEFGGNDSGTVAVTFGILAIALFGTVGLAITASTGLNVRTGLQSALDAAVLAGASLPIETDTTERIAKATIVFEDNLKKSGLTAGADKSSIAVEGAPVFLAQDTTVSGTATAKVKNFFAGIIGDDAVDIEVSSAARKTVSEPVCVLALDPVSPRGFEVYGTAQFTARNCSAQANSTDGAGMQQYGSAIATAKLFGVSGGFSGTGFTPAPIPGIPPHFDPYASIPVPPVGACVDIASKLMNTPAVLDPGTYCGGIVIKANSTIIMRPGVYVMKDGPFRIDSNSTVDGQEVTIAFTGSDSSLYLGSGAIVRLTSPTSGTYMNIQFYQDKASSTDVWATMLGDIRLEYDGVMYFPTQDVWIGGGSVIMSKSPTWIMVAKKLWFQDNSVIDVWQENSRNLPVKPSGRIELGPRLIR